VHDADIRRSLRAEVEERHRGDPDTRILEELGLRQGQVRVDVAVVNGVLKGYEIKSLADTLRRLPMQVEVYSQVLDYATIVLADSHRADACSMIPPWWEVIVAVEETDGVRLEPWRTGTPNPCVNRRALAELLWHAEAMELLRAKGEHRGLSGKPRGEAWDRVAQVCSTDEVRETVRARIKGRAARRSA
jgi:hypothetical protein